jgi:hypothetical protein
MMQRGGLFVIPPTIMDLMNHRVLGTKRTSTTGRVMEELEKHIKPVYSSGPNQSGSGIRRRRTSRKKKRVTKKRVVKKKKKNGVYSRRLV